MALPLSGISVRKADSVPYTPPVSGASATKDTAATEESTDAGKTRVQASAQLNASIVQSSLSISSANEPLALVLKSAITGINERLAPEFGENAIQNAASQDNSPEGTSGRIVSLSTAFFQAFKEKNPELSDDAAAQKFLDTIKPGIERGFKEARDILDSLKVLNGDVASNIDKTYDLVQQGLNQFALDHGVKKDDGSGSGSGGSSSKT